jgi:hypothetical protein
MTAKALLCRVLAVSTCCLMLTACGSKTPEAEEAKPAVKDDAQPAAASQPAPKPGGVKVEPAKTPAGTKTSSKAAPAGKPGSKAAPQLSDEEIHQKLNEFGLKTIADMNRYALPSKNKKEVTKNPDGSFSCRYVEVDPTSLKTSFKKPESSSAVTYIGYMTYDEGVYVCKAPTKEAAEAGPFTAQQRTSMTELIKYSPKTGWSY